MPGQLAAKVRAKYPGVYDDLDDAALEKAVLSKYPEYADLTEPQPTAAPKPAAPDRAGYYRGIVNAIPTVVDALPAIGGVAGGMFGGVPGAAIGGAMGAGYRQLAKHATEIPGAVRDVARNLMSEPVATARGAHAGIERGTLDTGVQAASQGGLQKAGMVLGAGAGKAGNYLMSRAQNLTDRLSREFPNLPQTMIEHSLTVTKGGLNQARKMLHTAKAEANGALVKADAAGARVPITAATDGLNKTLTTVMESGDIEGGLRALAAVERKMLGGRAADLTNVEADALKRSLQTEAKALYLASKMGNGRPNVSVRAQAIADMAQSLNARIADVTEKAGAAGYKAANADAAEMIGAVRGITKGTRSGSNLYQAMVRPGVGAVAGGLVGAQQGGAAGAVPGAVMGAALTSPAGMSRLAITLAKPSVQAMLKQSPRLTAMLAQIMAGSQE